MRYAYAAELLEGPDGITVTFPDVPGAITCGDTRDEALTRAEDALVSMMAALVEDNQPLPRPSPVRGLPVVSVPVLAAAKLALHDAMLAARMSNVELGRRLGQSKCAGCAIRCIVATSRRSKRRCVSSASGSRSR